MRSNILTFHLFAAFLFSLSTTLAHADVVKCSDAEGAITYTNDQCTEDLNIVKIIPENNAASPAAKTVRASATQTRWAAPMPHRNNRPDVVSIRSAKAALKLSDAERRQQHFKLASND